MTQFVLADRLLCVQQSSSGDDGAVVLGGLTSLQITALLRFVRALTSDRGLAEDIVQEVLLRLHTRTGATVEHAEAYARKMAVNEFISWRRKWGRIHVLDPGPDGGLDAGYGPAEAMDPAEEYTDLRALQSQLDRLSRKQRVAIVSRYFADQSDSDIALALGCSQNAVRSLISRGLAVLRVQYDDTTTRKVLL